MASEGTESLTSTARSHLAALPEELVCNISIKLGSDDIFAFRLTCKALEEKSFHEFAIEYFREKCFIFTSDSLKVLVSIARSKKLRGHLQHLWFMPSLFSDRVFDCQMGERCAWKPTVRQSEAWRQYIRDQKTLKQTGRDLEMLTEAFKLLPSFTTFTFVDNITTVSPGADLRGLVSSVRATNNTPANVAAHPKDTDFFKWKNHVWRTLMRAIANSGMSTLQHFVTDLNQVKNALSVAVNFGIEDKVLSGLGVALSKVEDVNLGICSRKPSKLEDEYDDGIDIVKGAKNMEQFAALLSSLRKLRLCYTYSPSSSRLCTSFLGKLNLTQLGKLNLESIFIEARSLAPMLRTLTAITDLRLVWINLTQGTWPNILREMQKLENLDHLHLDHLTKNLERACFLKPLPKVEGSTPIPPPPFVNPLNDDLDDDYYSNEDSDYDPDFENDEDMDLEDDDDDDYSDSEADDEQSEDTSDALNSDGIIGDVGAGGDPKSDSDSDDSMPDLVPSDTPFPTTAGPANDHALHPNATPTTATPTAPPKSDDDDDELSFGEGPARGMHICLQGPAKLQKYLPVFIREYHIIHPEDEDLGLGVGDPLNTLMNSFGVAMGVGPPPPGLFGPGAGGVALPMFMGPQPPPPGANGGSATGAGGAAAG